MPAAVSYYFVDEDAAADPPLPVPPLLDAAPPLLAPPLLEAAPPPVLPVAPVPPVSVLALEPGALGAVLEEDEDEPPGTTTVSRFSVVVEDDAAPLGAAPGTTVVVDSLRSHAEKANKLTTAKTNALRFISTLLSSDVVKAPPRRASTVPVHDAVATGSLVKAARAGSPGRSTPAGQTLFQASFGTAPTNRDPLRRP